MNAKELLAAADVLDRISVMLKDLPASKEDALSASLHCTIANMVVVELAQHMTEGVALDKALHLAAVGTLATRPAKAEVLRLLAMMSKSG